MKTNCAKFYLKSLCIKLVALRMNLYQEIAPSFKKFGDSTPALSPNLSLTPHPKPRVHKLVHVTLEIDFPIWKGTFKVSNSRENFVYILFISKYSYLYIGLRQWMFSKSLYAYIGKYIFVIFLSLFVIRNFRGTCSYNEMLKGYIARESLEILVLNLNLGDQL